MLNLPKCTRLLCTTAVTSIACKVLPKEAVKQHSIESKPFYQGWGRGRRGAELVFPHMDNSVAPKGFGFLATFVRKRL